MQQLKGEAVGVTYILSNYICGNNAAILILSRRQVVVTHFIAVGAAVE